ncbi:MAG: ROK family protein, partial [Solirubrobacterales bacterium]
LKEAGIARDQVLGVGMGLPGPIDHSTGAVGSSSILPGWVGIDAAAEIGARLKLPVQVENDANLGALALVLQASDPAFAAPGREQGVAA